LIKRFDYEPGQQVEKIGGDYTFKGVVVAAFEKTSRAERYVIEDDRGMLHIHSAKDLRLATRTPDPEHREKT